MAFEIDLTDNQIAREYHREIEAAYSISGIHELVEKIDNCLANRDTVTSFQLVEEISKKSPGNIAVAYYLAILFRFTGDIERAVQNIIKTDLGPGFDYKRQSFVQFLSWCIVFAEEQKQAIERRIPNIQLVSLPKSGSGAVSYFLAKYLDVPVARCSFDGSINGIVIKKWAEIFAKGGVVSHEHFPATVENIRNLGDSGISKVLVQVRDPRQAFHSLMHHELKHARFWDRLQLSSKEEQESLAEDFEQFSGRCINSYDQIVKWIEGWIRAEELGPLTVEFMDYDTFSANNANALGKICNFFNIPFEPGEMTNLVQSTNSNSEWSNFRSGDREEWRHSYSECFCSMLSERIPSFVIEKFGWPES